MFPNPLPQVVGLTLDSRRVATVTRVKEGSPAGKSGFKAGDQLVRLDGQAILSLSDMQWVLHHAASSDKLEAIVRRGDEQLPLTLTLEEGWRRDTDISWRVSSWPLRRMGTGGLLFRVASTEQRSKAGLEDDELALVVEHVGQYGQHAAAKRAGFRKGDIVVSFDGQTKAMTTSQLLAYAAQNTRPRQQIPVTVLRGRQRVKLRLPMQE